MREMRHRKNHALAVIAALIAIAIIAVAAVKSDIFVNKNTVRDEPAPDWVDVQLITVDGHSRRGVKLEEINDIVVHYVGNPNTTAQQNRNYFDGTESTVSSHFVVGLDGEIIQCLPLDEKSSATSERNRDTISIEVCHPDESGKFTEATYASLVRLTAWLCDTYGLSVEHVIRHYDTCGKECPLYFVEHKDAWERFKSDVDASI